MREVPRDDKWGEHAPVASSKDPSDSSQDAPSGQDETQLAILTMLMRLYDLNLAILNSMNENAADRIFEAHNRGEHFNPMIYIPDFSSPDEPNEG